MVIQVAKNLAPAAILPALLTMLKQLRDQARGEEEAPTGVEL